MIQISPILYFASYLPQASLNFAKHWQARPKTDARKTSLGNPLSHERRSIHSKSNMIRIEQVGGHQFNPISRRTDSLA